MARIMTMDPVDPIAVREGLLRDLPLMASAMGEELPRRQLREGSWPPPQYPRQVLAASAEFAIL
jgi:hypothetical protein